jgi:hypothetical protein
MAGPTAKDFPNKFWERIPEFRLGTFGALVLDTQLLFAFGLASKPWGLLIPLMFAFITLAVVVTIMDGVAMREQIQSDIKHQRSRRKARRRA